MDATLNVRMGSPLKERGDKVLREHGIGTSAAVRALWQELADTRKLPDFLARRVHEESEVRAKMHALDSLVGVAEGSLSALSDEELHAVGMARYGDLSDTGTSTSPTQAGDAPQGARGAA